MATCQSTESLVAKPRKPARRTRRRGNGEGSVYQRSDGRWVASTTIGNSTGKQTRRTVYGKTRGEAQDKLTVLQSSKLSGTLNTPDTITVGEYLELWLPDVCRKRVEDGTFENYSGIIKKQLRPRIGGLRLQRLTPLHVQHLYAQMDRDGVRPHGIKLAHCVLHKALDDALRSGTITRNVCTAVDPPKIRRREMQTLDAEQACKLLAAARGDRLNALYWVAITAGLRQGELFGLQWKDIDLKAGTLAVQRSQADIKGRLSLKPPKNGKTRRIELAPETVTVLAEHRQAAVAAGHYFDDGQRVFCNTDGGPLRRPDFHRRSFKPLLKRAGLDIKFHGLRHTSATLDLSLGTHPKIVQEKLGHANISMTLDMYSHVLPGM